MAVVNTKSTALTAADSGYRTQAPITVGPRRIYGDVGVVAVANGDSIASTYRLVRVPSSAGVRELAIKCTAITTGAADFGIYRTAADGGAVVDADFFASAVSIATALAVPTFITHEAGVYTVDKLEQPLWQALGLTADPKCDYDVVATLTGAATAAGTLTAQIEYTASN
jgi:hypothetical protein